MECMERNVCKTRLTVLWTGLSIRFGRILRKLGAQTNRADRDDMISPLIRSSTKVQSVPLYLTRSSRQPACGCHDIRCLLGRLAHAELIQIAYASKHPHVSQILEPSKRQQVDLMLGCAAGSVCVRRLTGRTAIRDRGFESECERWFG